MGDVMLVDFSNFVKTKEVLFYPELLEEMKDKIALHIKADEVALHMLKYDRYCKEHDAEKPVFIVKV